MTRALLIKSICGQIAALLLAVNVLVPSHAWAGAGTVLESDVSARSINYLAFNVDESYLVLYLRGERFGDTIHMWSCRDWKHVVTELKPTGHDATSLFHTGVGFDGSSVLLGTENSLVRVIADRGTVHRLKIVGGELPTARHSMSRLASGDYMLQSIVDEKEVTLTELRVSDDQTEAKVRNVVRIKSEVVTAVNVSAAADLAAIGVDTGDQRVGTRFRLDVWDLKTKKTVYSRNAHDDSIRAIAVSGTGGKIASGGADGKLVVWDARSGKAQTNLVFARGVMSVDFVSGSEEMLVVATAEHSGDDNVAILDLNSGKKVGSANCDKRGLYYVALSPSRKLVAAVGAEGRLRVWRTSDLFPDLEKVMKKR